MSLSSCGIYAMPCEGLSANVAVPRVQRMNQDMSYSSPGLPCDTSLTDLQGTQDMMGKIETDRENVALARMYTLLNHLTPLIAQAKRYQNKQARVQFCYAVLQADIEQIKGGIAAKFHPPSIEPRVISPIQGDYLILKRKAK